MDEEITKKKNSMSTLQLAMMSLQLIFRIS